MKQRSPISLEVHLSNRPTKTWAPTGFFPGVGNEGFEGQKSPAGSRVWVPVEIWGVAPEADEIFLK